MHLKRSLNIIWNRTSPIPLLFLLKIKSIRGEKAHTRTNRTSIRIILIIDGEREKSPKTYFFASKSSSFDVLFFPKKKHSSLPGCERQKKCARTLAVLRSYPFRSVTHTNAWRRKVVNDNGCWAVWRQIVKKKNDDQHGKENNRIVEKCEEILATFLIRLFRK